MEATVSLFANCVAAGFLPPILVLRFRELPDKPWPLSIAGISVFLTTDRFYHPLDFGDSGNGEPIDLVVDSQYQALQQRIFPSWSNIKHLATQLMQRGLDVLRVEWLAVRFVADVKGRSATRLALSSSSMCWTCGLRLRVQCKGKKVRRFVSEEAYRCRSR